MRGFHAKPLQGVLAINTTLTPRKPLFPVLSGALAALRTRRAKEATPKYPLPLQHPEGTVVMHGDTRVHYLSEFHHAVRHVGSHVIAAQKTLQNKEVLYVELERESDGYVLLIPVTYRIIPYLKPENGYRRRGGYKAIQRWLPEMIVSYQGEEGEVDSY